MFLFLFFEIPQNSVKGNQFVSCLAICSLCFPENMQSVQCSAAMLSDEMCEGKVRRGESKTKRY